MLEHLSGVKTEYLRRKQIKYVAGALPAVPREIRQQYSLKGFSHIRLVVTPEPLVTPESHAACQRLMFT